jgi:hypothetical protein
MGLKRLFETDDIEIAIRKLKELGVRHQVSRGMRIWVGCSVEDLPAAMRDRAAEISIDENRRNTCLGRLNDDGTYSPTTG